MWSYNALARRSLAYSRGGRHLRGTGVLVVTSLPSADDDHLKRSFATDDKETTTKKQPEKKNFDRDILQQAARGKLRQKHDSGIPKLLGRHKAGLGPPPRRSGGRFSKILKTDPDVQDDILGLGSDETLADMPKRLTGLGDATSTFSFDPRTASYSSVSAIDDDSNYYAAELFDDDRYYWNEDVMELEGEDLDEEDGDVNANPLARLAAAVDSTPIKPVRSSRSIDDDDGDDIDALDDDEEKEDDEDEEGRPVESISLEKRQSVIEDLSALGLNDVFTLAAMDEKQLSKMEEDLPDTVLPLGAHGSTASDFIMAMLQHPTKYAQLVSEQLHPDSKREPKPFIPKSRLNPPLSFVESHARFLFVSGLPPLEVNGEQGDVKNPVHRDSIQKTVARLFGVDSKRVFPSSASSAFIGFPSPRALAEALNKGPKDPVLNAPASITMYVAGEHDEKAADFVELSPRTIVEIRGIPQGNTTKTLIDKLFPEGSEAASVYKVASENVRFLSPTRALIRFDSEEQAESAVVSQVIVQQLKSLGDYPVRLFRARRELVHAGFDGPLKMKERREMGPRLIVDGDMPTKKFYLSHARVICLRNLDPDASKDDISTVFQPFSARPRDVDSSIEFVTCEKGLPTGRAFVGFDIPGEAEEAIKELNGLVRLGDVSANMRLVYDRRIPGVPFIKPEKRPDRSADELLDELNNWEQYVDPADIKVLDDAGISKVALDEALRGIRFNNASFGVLDSSIRAESIQPEKMTGELYKELVQMYIATLKECMATPENVGELYESVHFPGEQLDLSIFERETERQKTLHDRRS